MMMFMDRDLWGAGQGGVAGARLCIAYRDGLRSGGTQMDLGRGRSGRALLTAVLRFCTQLVVSWKLLVSLDGFLAHYFQ